MHIILFRWRVFRRAQPVHDGRRLGIPRIKEFDEAKVDQKDSPIGCQANVSRLNIAVDYTVLMDVFQC